MKASGTAILLVEDDPGLQLTIGDRLGEEGYEVTTTASGEDALHRAQQESFALVLLDVMLPGMSGFDVLVALRAAELDVPVLMLTARGQLADRVAGLKLGADDYLVKPFEMVELLARVEARVRRSVRRPSARVFRFADVVVDTRNATVERDGQAVELQAKEYRLLCYFLENPGKTLSRQDLLADVWGYSGGTASRTLDVHVAGLRKKLERAPQRPSHFLTIHGMGYKFVA